MGLFSFLKNAGSKIFGKPEPTATPEELHATKLESLNKVVSELELPIENLSIDLTDDQVTVYGETESQDVKEKIVLALGNVDGIASVDDRISVVNPEPEAVFYEVKSGDTLSKIAKQHYGNPMKYMVIFEANKPLLKDPNLIYPGQVLRIPPLPE